MFSSLEFCYLKIVLSELGYSDNKKDLEVGCLNYNSVYSLGLGGYGGVTKFVSWVSSLTGSHNYPGLKCQKYLTPINLATGNCLFRRNTL